MDLEEYQKKLSELVDAAQQKAVERVMVPAANKLLATVKNRIMLDGENTAGRQIGSYSTKAMYVSEGQFDKRSAFKPIGKNETKRKTVQVFDISTRKKKNIPVKEDYSVRKSMYLPQGYKQLRDIQGKPTDKVNLNYRGDLMLSYQQQVKDKEIIQGLISQLEGKKREGLEKKFGGNILAPQVEEINAYQKEVTEGFRQETLKILNA